MTRLLILLSLTLQLDASGLYAQATGIDTLYPYKLIAVPGTQNQYIVLSGNSNTSYFTKSAAHIKQFRDAIYKKQGIIIQFSDSDNAIKTVRSYRVAFKLPSDTTEIALVIPHLNMDVPSDSVNFLFRYFADLNCTETTQCNPENPCISFRYKTNGCNARAHWMRKLLAERFGYDCRKLFSEGNLVAINTGDCGEKCILWGWHVAVVLSVKDTAGNKSDIVMDPSLFNTAVSVDQWNQALCGNCIRQGKVTSTYFRPASTFTPNGSTDNNYTQTIKLLTRFCLKCNHGQ